MNDEREKQTYTQALQEVYNRLEGIEEDRMENEQRIEALERAIFRIETSFESFQEFMEEVKALQLGNFVGRMQGELVWIKLLVAASALAAVAEMILGLLGVE